MEAINALAFFILGFISGVSSFVAFTLFYAKRLIGKKKEEVKSSKPSVEDRMKRVKEITREQLDLAQRADHPQKNALDGKYKNSLIGQLKNLDEERNEIFRSLLTEGHDLELTTVDGAGVVTKMKLSEYMAYLGIDMSVKPKVESKTERMGKFTIYRGGKDDGGSTTH